MNHVSEVHYNALVVCLEELNFTPVPQTLVWLNEELPYAIRVQRMQYFNSYFFQLSSAYRNEYGEWVSPTLCTTVSLHDSCVEEVKTWLRLHNYPVDKILRIKRLRALISP